LGPCRLDPLMAGVGREVPFDDLRNSKNWKGRNALVLSGLVLPYGTIPRTAQAVADIARGPSDTPAQ
jgi:hypothetical protein